MSSIKRDVKKKLRLSGRLMFFSCLFERVYGCGYQIVRPYLDYELRPRAGEKCFCKDQFHGNRYQSPPGQSRCVMGRLTTGGRKPSLVIEQATSSYSFRSPELSQPI